MEDGKKHVRFQRKTDHISEMVRDRPRLLLITNRKWHTLFQMRWKSSTLDDLESHRQPVRSAILETAGLLVSKTQRLSKLC